MPMVLWGNLNPPLECTLETPELMEFLCGINSGDCSSVQGLSGNQEQNNVPCHFSQCVVSSQTNLQCNSSLEERNTRAIKGE